MEARLYAEDPERDFLPSIGQLLRYRAPTGEGIRVDSGVEEGGAISMYYDPMIAKLIAYGKDRDEAIDRLANALDHYEVKGIESNRQFLSSVLEHDLYRKGDITTGFIASEYEEGFRARHPQGEDLAKMVALAGELVHRTSAHLHHQGQDSHLIAVASSAPQGQEPIALQASQSDGAYQIIIGEQSYHVSEDVRQGVYQGLINDALYPAQLSFDNHHVTVTKGAMRLMVQILPMRMAPYLAYMPEIDESAGADEVIAPMPGLLTRLLVAEGDKVQKGQNVAVIEAMKMENMLIAEANGTVKQIKAAVGSNLNVEDLILVLALDDEEAS